MEEEGSDTKLALIPSDEAGASIDSQTENSMNNGSLNTCVSSLNCGSGNDTNKGEPPVSKRKLRKEEKLRLWEASKQQRKENRRKKKQEQKEKRRHHREKLKSEAIKEGLDPEAIPKLATRKKLKSNSMKNSSCRVGICIDMSFSDLMIEKDLHKCIKQISRCYSSNRRFRNPLQFHVTSFTGKAIDVMDKHDGWRNWDMNIHENSYLELEEYPKDKIVYLTAESENILSEPKDNVLYVIGGLVDHNSRKGLCHKLAMEKGVAHARLPLGEYIEMNRRKVLSILHVFEIVGNVAQNRPWQEVLMEVLPSRTQARLKQHSDDEDTYSDDDEDMVESNKCSSSKNFNLTSQQEQVSTSTPDVLQETVVPDKIKVVDM